MQTLQAAELISELGESIGIPGLRLDTRGCCRLLFDGSYMVDLHHVEAQSRWLLCCTLQVSALDDEHRQLLLRGNWAGGGFGGGWAGVNEQDKVVLHLPVAQADSSASALLQAAETLLNHAERWEQRLSHSSSDGRSSAPIELWAQRI